MGASERGYDRGTRQGERLVRLVADELRTARLSLGLSQSHVAKAARISRPMYGRIERGQYRNVPLIEIAQIGGVVGLELSARMYPGGSSTRDAAHARNLARVLRHVAPPLRVATDVPLPSRSEYPERRAWDAILAGRGERTALELETRLYDLQGQIRRIHLKLRDDPPDHLVLVVTESRTNRRALLDAEELLRDLPRLRTANVLRVLRAGQHPPTGLILLGARAD
jgi:transcriptional regulator with XRE-family HTH domain